MSLPGFIRARLSTTAPIKSYNRRGFIIGWLAIMVLAIAGYVLASSQLATSTAQLQLANIGGTVHTVLNPG